VVTDVHLGNAANDVLDNGYKIREPLSEVINTINTVLTLDVVTIANATQIFLLLQDTGECIVAIAIPVIVKLYPICAP
jgi:hypothetical protein